MTPWSGSIPDVTVCIPAYARKPELRDAIESVLGQTVPVSEILIGDDSGDLQGVVGEFDDPRVKYIKNCPRRGMAGNWNSLLDRARGEFVALLMDDDMLAPTFIERCLAGFSSDDVGLSFSNHDFVNDQGERWTRRCALSGGMHRDFLVTLLELRPVAVSAAIMRRVVWEQVRPLPDILTADLYMHARIAASGWSFYYVDEPLMSYRVHDGQLSSSKTRFRDDGVHLWELLEFDSGKAESLRKEALAKALVSRAAARVGRDEVQSARCDLRKARKTNLVATLTPRYVATVILSWAPAQLRSAVFYILRRGLGHRVLELARSALSRRLTRVDQ